MSKVLHAIKYPFAIDSGGGQAKQEADYEDYVRQLIRQVLMTAPGERVNRPDFGAGVRRMVFAPNNPATASLTQTLIYQALSRWLATVIKVEEVAVSAEQEKLLITVHYMVIQRGTSRIINEEVTF